MDFNRARIAVALLLLLLAAACNSNTEPLASLHSSNPQAFPTLQEVARRAAADSDAFLPQQYGAQFAADLLPCNCTADGNGADLAPGWFPAFDHALSDAAFCIYRLSYDPAKVPVKLELDWSTPPAVSSDCWVGLSDWTTGAWQWQTLPAGGELALASPEKYVDGAQHCYVAVLLLGPNPSSLATIRFDTTDPPPPANSDGYTLVSPVSDTDSYLIDMDGDVVHTWASDHQTGLATKLLENGHLLRAERLPNPQFGGGGTGGLLVERDWDGNLVWSYELNTDTQCLHHSFTVLPNGHVLLIVWNFIPDTEVVAAGRDPATFDSGLFWADSLIEVEPTYPSGGNIVWQWNVMDHLVQDFDDAALNFGDPATHHELMDINFPSSQVTDWTHFNTVAYNAEFDQVMVTSPTISEIWVMDHSTTTAEAAGHSGGRYGHGGDLLYRWGNPEAYRAGDSSDRTLFFCHNGHWIADGLSGAGNVLIFNNNAGFPEHKLYSSVVEITLPQNPDGTFNLDGPAYGPDTLAWQYHGQTDDDVYSPNMSSAQRLPGGNTLVCSAWQGLISELRPNGSIAWHYQNNFPSVGMAIVFDATRYPLNYPGVAGLE